MPRVIAAPGLRVPLVHAPRRYVHTEPVDVPDNAYFRRRLAAGELLVAPADAPATPAAANLPATDSATNPAVSDGNTTDAAADGVNKSRSRKS